MTPTLPFVSCLTPTYKRPRLLENAIACFLEQDYPADRRELIICDDAQQIAPHSGDGWVVFSVQPRFRSLPAKYNWLVSIAKGEILAVWEDDDIFLPWHISANVAAMRQQDCRWSHNTKAFSLYTGQLEIEPARGRFHSSLVIERGLLQSVGGWPETSKLSFDQQLIQRLTSAAEPADPCETHPPGYCFRWGSTGAYHGQAYSEDNWYQQVAELDIPCLPVQRLTPKFDSETARVLCSVVN